MPKAESSWFIRSRLKTRQIVLLLQLYQHRSVLKAAEAAGMTQPAASKLLAELEHALGVQLFKRHARGVEPTWYGEILVRHARSALAEISRAHDEIQALKAGLSGQASIGTVMNPGAYLIPPAVAAIKRNHPGLLLNIEMDHSPPLVAKLLEGRLDIVVGRILDAAGASELNFEPLADEPHSIVVRADHALTRKRSLSFEQLLEYGWIMPPAASVLRSRLNSMFHELGAPPPGNVLETSALPVIIAVLQTTDMVTALPAEAVQAYCNAGLLKILPIPLNVTMDSFGIITRRLHTLAPGAEVALRLLRETAAKLYPRPKARTAAATRT